MTGCVALDQPIPSVRARCSLLHGPLSLPDDQRPELGSGTHVCFRSFDLVFAGHHDSQLQKVSRSWRAQLADWPGVRTVVALLL